MTVTRRLVGPKLPPACRRAYWLGLAGLAAIAVLAACSDSSAPLATSEPLATPIPETTPTSTPVREPTATPLPIPPTATPTTIGMLTPTRIPPIEPTQTPMPTATPPPGAAAAAIDALPWVQDDMTTLERSIVGDLQTLAARAPEVFWELMHKPWMEEMREDTHGTELQEMVVQLFSLALHHRQVFWDLVHKPWMQDDLTGPERQAIFLLAPIANADEAAALQIIGMPFLDSMDRGDLTILDTLRTLEGEGLRYLLSHPTLIGGITDDQRAAVALLRLEWQYPETAAVILALPWVRDGIAPSEVESAIALQELALKSRQVLQALAQKPWMQDGLTPDESSMTWKLRSIRDESAALRILDMAFLETVDGVDAAAMEALAVLSWESDRGYLEQVLSHPTLRDGITDDQTVVVAALQSVVRHRPELLDTLLNPDQVTVEKRVIRLPHSGEVTLSVIHVIPGTYRTMDMLEQMVRTQEGFMAVPFPRSYVGLLAADAIPVGGGPSGIITVDPGSAEDDYIIAHELAHTYWSFFPPWLREGAADFMTTVSADAEFSSNKCSLADNLSDLEHIESGLSEDIIYRSGCSYALGRGLFLDLYEALGDEAFRQGFGRLYLTMRGKEHDDECTGLERGVCYVRAAFVTDALPESAALAEPVIVRWYYGSPPSPTATHTPTPEPTATSTPGAMLQSTRCPGSPMESQSGKNWPLVL